MGLVSIGPIPIAHGDPEFSWESAPITHGLRSGSVGGSCSWPAAKQLSELVLNPEARLTIGGRTGVPEFLVFADTLLEDFTGYYLLEGCSVSPAQQHSLTTEDVPFRVAGAYLGDLTASIQTLPGIAVYPPQRVVALPPSSLDPTPGKMRLRINDLAITRDYDPALVQP